MLKGILMSIGLLLYYMIYGKKRLAGKQLTLKETGWISLLFLCWLLCTLLFFSMMDIDELNLLWGILLIASFPVFCVVWKIKVIKEQPLNSPTEKYKTSSSPIPETVTFVNPSKKLTPPIQYPVHPSGDISPKTPSPKRSKAKGIMIAAIIALSIALLALGATFVLSLKNYQDSIDRLNAKNSRLQSQVESIQSSLSEVQSDLEEKTKEAESWKNQSLGIDVNSTENATSFTAVTDLLSAIKRNAEFYNNREIVVVGTIYKSSYGEKETILINSSEELAIEKNGEFNAFNRSEINHIDHIDIIISNDLQYTVVETNDLVKITGKVMIKSGEIYLNNCNCEIITPGTER